MFSTMAAAMKAADQLVAIAKYYGFEGWLINIENSLTKQEVQHMLLFVGYLRARMKSEVPHAVVIW